MDEAKRELERVKSAFGKCDPENEGFIQATDLRAVLRDLKLGVAEDEREVVALATKIEMEGSGIILWGAFWEEISKILRGSKASDAKIPASGIPELRRKRSDSDLAREAVSRPRSDSQIARELQSQTMSNAELAAAEILTGEWHCPACTLINASMRTSCELCGTKRSKKPKLENVYESKVSIVEELATPEPAAEAPSLPKKVALPDGFDLYHYNGLSVRDDPLKLTRFCVAPLLSEDNFLAVQTGGLGVPIEDTIHCRWPGASIHWYDAIPAKI